jgi:hypothetical protein
MIGIKLYDDYHYKKIGYLPRYRNRGRYLESTNIGPYIYQLTDEYTWQYINQRMYSGSQ